MKPTNTNINELFDIILANKKLIREFNLVPLSQTNYSNVKFDNDSTRNDRVNKSLLDDLQRAASSVGVVATITTAKSGHSEFTTSKNKSRHMTGAGVDVGILNGINSGGATNSTNGNDQFRELGDKLASALESMGYKRNVESGNAKAVLWQTNTGGNHFNHLHVSNNTGQSSNLETELGDEGYSDNEPQQNTQSQDRYQELDNTNQGFLYNIAKGMAKDLKLVDESVIVEGTNYPSFGKNAKEKYGSVKIPEKDNPIVRSPVSGKIDPGKYNLNCKNQVFIKFMQNNDVYFLEYCGLKSTNFSVGDIISNAEVLGHTDSDVEVSLYNKLLKKIDISNFGQSGKNPKTGDDDDLKTIGGGGGYGPRTDIAKLLVSPFNIFKNEYDTTGGTITKNYALPTDKVQPKPFWKTKSFKKNVDRIKKLMK